MERLLWTHIVHMIQCNTTDLIRACFLGIQFLCTGGIACSVGKNFQWVTQFKRQLQNISSFAFFFKCQSIAQFKYGNTACQRLLDTWVLQQNISTPTSWILAHLLYNIQLIQFTAANMFVQLCLDVAQWFSLNWRVFWGFIFLPWADRSGQDLSYLTKMMVLSP